MVLTTCPNCGKEIFITSIEKDNLGWHTSCPECDGSFDFDFAGINIHIIRYWETEKPDHKQCGIICDFMKFKKDLNTQWSKAPDNSTKLSRCIIDGVDVSVTTFGDIMDLLEASGKLAEDYQPAAEPPLTRREAIRYCLQQGTGIVYDGNGHRHVEESTIEWLLCHSRPNQAAYAVRAEVDLIDFDEWMAIENILYKDYCCETLPYETALKINGALWEDLDETPLELDN